MSSARVSARLDGEGERTVKLGTHTLSVAKLKELKATHNYLDTKRAALAFIENGQMHAAICMLVGPQPLSTGTEGIQGLS